MRAHCFAQTGTRCGLDRECARFSQEPAPPESFSHRRVRSHIRQRSIPSLCEATVHLENTWAVEASASALETSRSNPNWSVTTYGPNWCTESNVELLGWDDLVNADAKGSRIVRLFR